MPLIVQLSEGQIGIIERNGKYHTTVHPRNLHFIVPVIDQIYIYEMKPKIFNLSKFSALIKNTYTIDVEASLKYKIVEPRKARYEVENKDLEYTIERFVIKQFSTAVNKLELEEAIAARVEISDNIKRLLDNQSRTWGFKLMYFEIKSVKKSFLAEQEIEKLYDVHAGEKGVYMSEKIDLRNPAKAVHYKKELSENEEEQETSEYIDFSSMAPDDQKQVLTETEDTFHKKIEELETEISELDDEEMQSITRQQLEIYKEHQRDMLHLQEKDIKQQQDDLMFQIQEMKRMQEELMAKQEALLKSQEDLASKKHMLEEPKEED